MTTANSRSTDYPIDPLFLQRWSPRSFTGAPMPEYELLTILEAARWAPSAFNSQPWRFIYARRDTEHWPKLLGLLTESNQLWAKNASVLIILVSKTTVLPRGAEKAVPSWSHSLDAGAAWCSLALQAHRSGWAAHGMVGFDKERAAAELGVPAGLSGRGGHRHRQAGRQVAAARGAAGARAPNDRTPLRELVREGHFGAIKSVRVVASMPGGSSERDDPAARRASPPSCSPPAARPAWGAENKLLADIGGKPMVRRVVETALASTARPVLVVTGHHGGRGCRGARRPRRDADRQSRLRDGPRQLAQGRHPRRAARMLPAPWSCSATCRALRVEHIDRLIEAFAAASDAIVVPVHEGRQGNPVLWPRRYFPQLLQLEGDAGAKRLIAVHGERGARGGAGTSVFCRFRYARRIGADPER